MNEASIIFEVACRNRRPCFAIRKSPSTFNIKRPERQLQNTTFVAGAFLLCKYSFVFCYSSFDSDLTKALKQTKIVGCTITSAPAQWKNSGNEILKGNDELGELEAFLMKKVFVLYINHSILNSIENALVSEANRNLPAFLILMMLFSC